jgi:hypothetical protein
VKKEADEKVKGRDSIQSHDLRSERKRDRHKLMLVQPIEHEGDGRNRVEGLLVAEVVAEVEDETTGF